VRVAALAAAIATEMDLPADQIEAVEVAGMVHDLGKIQIPAEILSKPGEINEIEHSLIKTHPQAGYDILKGIHFPWPIADIVLQHHERLDGSGYPHGLKDGGILLGARILSVADVVEAMSSHRPYRPSLGIEAALAEITQFRDVYFDPQVVDACLSLFRKKNYQLCV
jgi:putative nucleotidyltransferase with HDIG domain